MSTTRASIYDLTPGAVFAERYRVVGPHRQGGLSTAFEVVDGNEERCELQVFPAGLFESPQQAKEFIATLLPWKEVACDGVLRTRELLPIQPSTLALVTDFPAGESLRACLNRRGRFGGGEVVQLGCNMLDGLDAIHERSLVHGDIKPGTVHVQGDPRPTESLLVDGGVTKGLWMAKVRGLGERTALIGTPHYAPIEQFGGDPPDVRSDIYNVAAVLFECATGVLPWPGTSFLEVFQAKLSKTPPSMTGRAPGVRVDPRLEEVIVRGCHANRHERFDSAREFRDALARLG
jgi:serine/threonine-protein kinase